MIEVVYKTTVLLHHLGFVADQIERRTGSAVTEIQIVQLQNRSFHFKQV